MAIKESIVAMIEAGKPDETIDLLIEYGKGNRIKSPFVSLIAADYNQLKRSAMEGSITDQQYATRLVRINKRILTLISNTVFVSVVHSNFVKIVSAILIVFAIGFAIYEYFHDPLIKEKLELYSEMKEIVQELSSYEVSSNEYNDSKAKLDKMLNGGIDILKDSISYDMLIEYYYDLEQYERISEIGTPEIQQKSSALTKHLDSILLKLE